MLLLGETGTGKSLLARLIHERSDRRNHNFVTVNCPALPDGLFERELFGHVAGAYTGADSSQPGLVEGADGGTLFLDEISELPLAAQAKLLLSVETLQVRRLGSPAIRTLDFRVISATNGNLAQAVRVGKFRGDLLHRLSVLEFCIPPLRHRRREIPALVHHLLKTLGSRRPAPSVHPDAMEALVAYDWPGNIRELDHVLRRAAALATEAITPDHLTEAIRIQRSRTLAPPQKTPFAELNSLEQRQLILEALRRTRGNRTHAARLLGIARSTLWMKLRLLELEQAERPASRTAPPGRSAGSRAASAPRRRLPVRSETVQPELVRSTGDRGPMDRIRFDCLQAARALRARPGSTAALIAVLSLGIGLVTAMFALADPFLLRDLPYRAPDRLIALTVRATPADALSPGGFPTVADWQARTDLFEDLSAYVRSDPVRFGQPGGARVLRTAQVTETFLEVLGVSFPAWTDMTHASAPEVLPVAMLPTNTHRSRPDAAAESPADRRLERHGGGWVHLRGTLPRDFLFPTPDVTFPIEAITPVPERHVPVDSARLLIGRLHPGVPIAAVQSALGATLPKGAALRVQTLHTHLTERGSRLAAAALGAGVLILLVCTANVGSLLLARSMYRIREFATRRALGASVADLARLLLTELAMIALAAVSSGLVVASLVSAGAARLMPLEYTALGQPGLSHRAWVFAVLCGLLVVVLGLIPTAVAWRARLKPGGMEGAEPQIRSHRTLRFTLLATQTGVAVLLAIVAAVLTRSHLNLVTQETGFRGDILVISSSHVTSGAALQRDIDETVNRLQRLPGITGAGAAVGSMLDRLIMPGAVLVRGTSVRATQKRVTPGYFEAVGSTLIAGRTLTRDDSPTSAIVVSQSLANLAFPNQSPVGQRVGRHGETEIVGVVKDELNFALDVRPQPTVFSKIENPWENCTGAACGQVSYVLRLAPGAPDVRRTAAHLVAAVSPDAVVFDTSSLAERLAGSIQDRAFAALIVACFAAAAVTVCGGGLIGIVTFIVTRRTRELAIRIAVGALPRHVFRTVLAEPLSAAALGIVAGLCAGRWTVAGIQHLAFGLRPGEWTTTAFALVMLLIVLVLAAVLPARRALTLSPSEALRME